MAQLTNIMKMAVIVERLVRIRITERNADVHLDTLVNDVKVRYLFPVPSLLGGHILFVFGPFVVY